MGTHGIQVAGPPAVPDGDLRLVPLHLGRGAALLRHTQQGGMPSRLLVHAAAPNAQATISATDHRQHGPHLCAKHPQVLLRQLSEATLTAPLLLVDGRILALPLRIMLLAALHRATLLQPLAPTGRRLPEAGLDGVESFHHDLVDAVCPVICTVQDTDELRSGLGQHRGNGAADRVAWQQISGRAAHLHVADLHLDTC